MLLKNEMIQYKNQKILKRFLRNPCFLARDTVNKIKNSFKKVLLI